MMPRAPFIGQSATKSYPRGANKKYETTLHRDYWRKNLANQTRHLLIMMEFITRKNKMKAVQLNQAMTASLPNALGT